MENYTLKNGRRRGLGPIKKNDVLDDDVFKTRLEQSCMILQELCIYDVLGGIFVQKHRKITNKNNGFHDKTTKTF